ncbi:TRAP transporter substrate-binding protein DctP [Oceanibacterium hippocampi]|uniref:Lactate-binding periplasmic protein n=1 Tax=Oceanibacterium hippocampi TaxID=745714 RepID=A0A1Y5TXP6_9PROT|nr:TRAP transporter substrate-binding protein DctP [Oceanibacterium hippocampi]SLN76354.1 Lactate-binding periplasmic protein precursor [Oceanibacterium hippocampi]
MKRTSYLIAAACGAALLAAAGSASAETTLRAVSAFADDTTFSVNFQRFIDKVNESGKGVIQINYVGGGGKVMNPFELGNAVKTGVVDIGNLPGAFYTNLLPEADAIKLSRYTIQEERQNGAWAYMNKLHNEKVNAELLARQKDCVPFHIYLNKKIDKPDLTGLKIRVTPIYRAFFAAMGAENIRTAPGEVYTALERGTVDGYGWPTVGVLDLGWHEVTKYRVDPGFYRASVEILMNLDSWKKLSDAERGVINSAVQWLESLCEEDKAIAEKEIARQTEAGIQAITFEGQVADDYLQLAYDSGWKAFLEANTEHGPKLQELLSK